MTTGVRVEANMLVNADAATMWSTLTDYNRLAEFVPNMVVSRIISRPGQPTRVEQRSDSGIFSFVMPDHVVLALEESQQRKISFRAVSGSILAMQGEWRIHGENNPIRLTYRAHLLPMVPPPPLVSEGFIADEVRARFEAVGHEAERRMRRR
jgi:ribosome-associated toxin RatA of RatAB toxin-antitoxin module